MPNDYEYVRKFVIQKHQRSSSHGGDHWDLRIENTKHRSAWSWALPKQHMPKEGEHVAAYRASDHPVNYMKFHGKLDNGDKVSIYDHGDVAISIEKGEKINCHFKGQKVNGKYTLIRLKPKPNQPKNAETWLIIKNKREKINDSYLFDCLRQLLIEGTFIYEW